MKSHDFVCRFLVDLLNRHVSFTLQRHANCGRDTVTVIIGNGRHAAKIHIDDERIDAKVHRRDLVLRGRQRVERIEERTVKIETARFADDPEGLSDHLVRSISVGPSLISGARIP